MRWSYRFGLCLGLDLVVVLCVLFMALEPRAEAGVGAGDGEGVAFGSGIDIAVAVAQKNEIRIVHPTKGARISGATHIKLKVGQSIKKVFVFIDDKYFASGPPYNIFWNSSTVSNGPHRITVATATPALSSAALFLASQSQTAQFFVHNPPAWPAGVPTPAAIPTLTPPVNPITVGPGTNGVVGNATQNASTGVISGTDDTNAFQTLINSHDIIVQAGSYRIAGYLTPPNGRVIQCQPGATFYASNDSEATIVNLGWFGGSPTNITISGCTFAGTDTPTGGTGNNFGNSNGGSMKMIAISGNGYGGANNINIQHNTFKNSQDDMIIVYDNCGTAETGNCNGLAPGSANEGPHNIYIANNTFIHGTGGPAVHINGGHNVYVYNNTVTDDNINQEEDPTTLQVINGLYIYKNTLTLSSYGIPQEAFLTCLGNVTITGNGSGCWAVQNTVSGCPTTGTNTSCQSLAVGCPNVQVSGNSTGNYYGNIVQNGATYVGSCGTNQLTTPYCNGVTCDTTGWLNVPPTPN